VSGWRRDKMKVSEIRCIAGVLSEAIGWGWPLFLAGCLRGKRAVVARTHWAGVAGPERDFVQRLSLAASVYLALQQRLGREEAFEAMRKILVPVGCREQWDHLKALDTSGAGPMDQLMAFHDLMDREGTPRFNRREYVERDENVCHFLITRCVFHDFFAEAGTPELTKLFCEVDGEFFPAAFPELAFHRDGSWGNTIAFGKDRCEFVFERKGSIQVSEEPR
jgi:hypothetical protein